MPMHLKSFRKWIRQIYNTWDEELDCDEVYQVLPQYVELEIAGKEAEQCFPNVRHHLRQCTECYDLHLTLRDVALLEGRQVASEVADLQRS